MKPFSRILTLLAVLLGMLAFPVAADESDSYTRAELEQMLAPVALYPDTVLSHVLIAATFPLEVVQAERWVKTNRDLTGEAAVSAVENKDWNPSVKALVAFPQIIVRMSEDLEWTEDLGSAFSADEQAVLAAIQDLRQRAYAEGNLDSLEHVRVEREEKTIVIEPAVREVVYIPYYDTRVVYGDWRWHTHPPVYWEVTHYYPARRHSSHFYWSTGVQVHPAFYFSAFHWDRYHVVVVDPPHWVHRPRYYSNREIIVHGGAKRWRHDPRYHAPAERPPSVRGPEPRRYPYGRTGNLDSRPGYVERVQPPGRPSHINRPDPIIRETPAGRHGRTIQTGPSTQRHNPRTSNPRVNTSSQREAPAQRTRSVGSDSSRAHRLIRTVP